MSSSSGWEVGRAVVGAIVVLLVSGSADPTLGRGARIDLYFILAGVARAAGRLLVGGGMWGPATRWGPAYLRAEVGIMTCVARSCFCSLLRFSEVPFGSFFEPHKPYVTNLPYTLTVHEGNR